MTIGDARRRAVSAVGVAGIVVALLAACGSSPSAAPAKPAHAAVTVPSEPSDSVSPALQPGLSPAVRREMAYVDKYWQNRNEAKFGNLHGRDCVNFTSQALLARGWKMTPSWQHSFFLTVNEYSPAWISSTSFMRYMLAHPKLGKPLTWAQRDQVAVGDVVQFDYNNSGNRDHTAVVSRITGSSDSLDIRIAQHSAGALYRTIAFELSRHPPGGKVYFWHLSD